MATRNWRDYQVLKRLNTAGVEGLFHARHVPTGSAVLLDVRRSTGGWSDETRRWEVCHPHLLPTFEAVRETGRDFAVHVGDRLRSYFTSGPIANTPSYEQIAREFAGLAEALHALHAHRVWHGELHPDCVFIDGPRVVLLVPMRRPKPAAVDGRGESPGRSPWSDYAAPELSLPGASPGVESDVFALGRLLQSRIGGDRLPEVPPLLLEILETMLDKDPARRFDSMRRVAELLRGLGVRSSEPAWSPGSNASALDAYLRREGRRLNQPAAAGDSGGNPAVDEGSSSAPKSIDISSILRIEKNQAIEIQNETIQIETAPSRSGPGKPRSSRQMPLAITAIVCGILAIAVVTRIVSHGWRPNASPAQTTSAVAPKSNDLMADSGVPPDGADRSESQAEATAHFRIEPDDGHLLWLPPSDGPPIPLEFAPQGANLLCYVRGTALSTSPEYERIQRSLGANILSWPPPTSLPMGIEWSDLEWVLLSACPKETEGFDTCGVALTSASTQNRLKSLVKTDGTQGNGRAQDGTWRKLGENNVWWIEANPPLLVWGTEAHLDEIRGRRGVPPLLRRELGALHAVSDRDAAITVILAPNFWKLQAEALLGQRWRLAQNWLDSQLREEPRGMMVRVDLSPSELYLEMRWIAPRAAREEVARRFAEGISRLPELAQDWQSRARPDPSVAVAWQKIAPRLDPMARLFAAQARIGMLGEQGVANWSLPAAAGHNFLVAIDWSGSIAGSMEGADLLRPAGPITLAALLREKISYSVPQQSLEFILRDLAVVAEERLRPAFPVRIVLHGKGLELDGITRNQQIKNLDLRELPFAEVLTEIMRRGNPVAIDQPPHADSQKLVWLIADRAILSAAGLSPGTTGEPVILVTTRRAARELEWDLPPIFRAP